jgi:hypothetical protein
MEANNVNVGELVFIISSGTRGVVTSKQTTVDNTKGCAGGGYFCSNQQLTFSVLIPETNIVLSGLYASSLQRSCEVAFPVGTRVQSRLCGGFTGVVTSHEIGSNRIVCYSDKTGRGSKDRVRYSYGFEEIEVLIPDTKFQLNHKYQDNCGKIYRVIECPKSGDSYLLIDDSTGKVHSYINTIMTVQKLNQLKLYGLTDISQNNYKGGL